METNEAVVATTAKFEMVKNFDCQKMPFELKQKFIEYCCRVMDARNYFVVKWNCNLNHDGCDNMDCDDDCECPDVARHEFTQWFLDNGAEVDEYILVDCWW